MYCIDFQVFNLNITVSERIINKNYNIMLIK